MKTPDTETLEAIERLNNTRDFKTFVQWLEGEVEAEIRAAIQSPDSSADVRRGRSQFGMEVIETVHDNANAVQRMLRRRKASTPVR